MGQKSYYKAETFDLATAAVTYSTTLASAKYTAGVAYYARLDIGSGSINGYLSALWSKGTGTAGTVYLGLYELLPGGLKLSKLGVSANQGGATNGVIRVAMTTAVTQIESSYDSLYAALLVATDAATDHVDIATSTAYAANSDAAVQTDPTGGGGFGRAFYGAGTSLTVLPATETISGVTASGLLPWFAID